MLIDVLSLRVYCDSLSTGEDTIRTLSGEFHHLHEILWFVKKGALTVHLSSLPPTLDCMSAVACGYLGYVFLVERNGTSDDTEFVKKAQHQKTSKIRTFRCG